MARTPRLRHLRHGKFERVRRNGKVLAFLADKATDLTGTGVSVNFTTDVQVSVGTLTAAGNVANLDTVTVGSTVYTTRSSLAAVKAAGVLTLTGNAGDTETVTIGSKTYTFQSTLTNVDGNVKVGATASDSIDNLIAAITLGAGGGTLYAAATTAHSSATATAGAGDTMNVEALTAGTAGNSIATTETLANGSFASATLTGGLAAAVYGVKIGASASDTLDNLIAAINGGAGAGTNYSSDVVAHPSVSAAAGAGDTMDVTALVAGAAGNSIATTDVSSNLSWGAATLTGGITSNNCDATAHGRLAGDGPFKFTSSGTAPGGLSDDAENYFVKRKVDNDNFTLSQGPKGAETNITADGTGTQTVTKTEDEKAVFEAMKRNTVQDVAAATDADDL